MLTKKNKRMVRKMRKYIKTFPLTEKEINQMVEDITGMAEEAQERNEDFEIVLGKPVREFCDDLIYSVGGIRAPGGRKLLRGTSIYFQILGLWGIVGCLISVCFFAGERVHTLWMLAISIGIWYLGPAIAITCLFFSICSFISNAFSDKCIGIVLFLNGTSWHFSTFLIYFTGSASSLSLFSCRITIPITQPKIVTGEPDNPW